LPAPSPCAARGLRGPRPPPHGGRLPDGLCPRRGDGPRGRRLSLPRPARPRPGALRRRPGDRAGDAFARLWRCPPHLALRSRPDEPVHGARARLGGRPRGGAPLLLPPADDDQPLPLRTADPSRVIGEPSVPVPTLHPTRPYSHEHPHHLEPPRRGPGRPYPP